MDVIQKVHLLSHPQQKSHLCRLNPTPEISFAAGGISRRFLLLFIILSGVQLQCVSPSPLNHPLVFSPCMHMLAKERVAVC